MSAPFHPCCTLGSFLSFPLLWPLIVAIGLVAFDGMAGCLVSAAMVIGLLGPLLLVSWLAWSWTGHWTPLDYQDADGVALEMSDHPQYLD